ncbi:MAG: hypothetical protein U9R43_16670 [Thermodesulfobacteriota bacterium]|nr:hypothetical protein [Thermodesulfobacteriota bacterium]
MLIKTDKSELEISKETNVYLGSLSVGQIFKDWTELDDNAKAQLEKIHGQAEKLIRQSEEILTA